MPLSRAIVQFVMAAATAGKWKWSTISGALSSACSALRSLTLYTNQLHGIDLRADPYFADSMAAAQTEARRSSVAPQKSRAISPDEVSDLRRVIKDPAARLLLELAWITTCRVGDLRVLEPKHVMIAASGDDSLRKVSLLFTRGKGVAFWGPFSIIAYLPAAIAKDLAELCANRADASQLFEASAQAVLSKHVNALPDCSLRSLRRGALVRYSEHGATDRQLQLASGHHNVSTLMRYLGWGRHSGEAGAAALARARLTGAPVRGGEHPGHPKWMGIHSGFGGIQGRRVPDTPQLFPQRPPRRVDLGLQPDAILGDPSSWPLHVEDFPLLNLDALASLISDPDLAADFRKARACLEHAGSYGVDWPPLVESQIPLRPLHPGPGHRDVANTQGRAIRPLRSR
jgi:hypothetical protein